MSYLRTQSEIPSNVELRVDEIAFANLLQLIFL